MQADQSQALQQHPIARIDNSDIKPLMALADAPENRHGIVTNFNGVGIEAASFITNALAKPGLHFDELKAGVFNAKYYLAHVAEVVAADGEVIPITRIVLLGRDGEVMAGVSEGATRSLDLIRSLCGDGPWEPPLPISVVEVKTRRGFRTYRLVIGATNHEWTSDGISGGGNQPEGQDDNSQRGHSRKSR